MLQFSFNRVPSLWPATLLEETPIQAFSFKFNETFRNTTFIVRTLLGQYIDSGIKLVNNKYNQKLPYFYVMTKWMANLTTFLS